MLNLLLEISLDVIKVHFNDVNLLKLKQGKSLVSNDVLLA